LLAYFLKKRDAWQPDPALWLFLRQVLAATLVMAAVLLWLRPAAIQWTDANALTRIGWLVLLIGGGAGVYAISGWLAGLHPRRVWEQLKNVQ
ncbi:MAG: hypothetical protein B7X28_09470, partial [Halothiobacillus sp. 13-55-253]